MKKHFNIQIYGLVQGVFFRTTAKEQADKLSLTGFAKNIPDGSVHIEAEGEKEKLDKFLKWCYSGPSIARVERVENFEGSLKNFKEFQTK